MSWRRSGKVRTSKSCTVRCDSGIPSSAVASRTSRASVSGANPVGQRPRRDRERDVAHLAPLLDEARHRPTAAELPVVGVRREDERALETREHERESTAPVPARAPATARRGGAGRRGAAASSSERARRARRARAAPRSSGPRRTRRRRRCARRSRASTMPVASETRDVNPRPSPRRVASNAAATSQARSATPTTPCSASTVTGVVCEATRFGSRPGSRAGGRTRARTRRRRPPAPGCRAAIRKPCPTRFARPEVIRLTLGARLADELVADLRDGDAARSPSRRRARRARASPAGPTRRRPRRRCPTASATKLDCENEIRSPSHVAQTTA